MSPAAASVLSRPAEATIAGVARRPASVASASVEAAQPYVVRSGRVLSLLLALEALRQMPAPLSHKG